MENLYYSDSEFDSEAEDIECRLYAQLYFGNGNNEEPIAKTAANNLELSASLSNTVSYLENNNVNLDVDEKLAVNKVADVTVNKISQLTFDKSENFSKRKRNLSICSIDSISGKEPLDNLYCHYNDFEESLLQESTLDTIAELNSFQEDGEIIFSEEESRYSILSKTNKSEKKNLIAEMDSCSSSEEEICILPPEGPKNIETLTVLSTSDSEESIQLLPVNEIKKHNLKRKLISTSGMSKKTNVQGISSPITILSDFSSSTEDSECEFLKVTSSPMTPLTINVRKNKYLSCTTFNQDSFNPENREKSCFQKSQVIFSKNRPLTKRKPSCSKWSIEMASFYDSDISDEFDVEEIHNSQSDDSSKWIISSEDKYVTPRNRYFNKQVRCFRCKEYGHNINKCSKVPHCLYCSSSNHIQLNQCPSLCCLKCGEKVHGYKGDCNLTIPRKICTNCGQAGHQKSICPDMWRCFYFTTKGSVPIRPSKKKDKNSKKGKVYCYNCAKKGHYGIECPNKNWKKYSFVTTLAINFNTAESNFQKIELGNKENYVAETFKVNLAKAVHFIDKRNLVLNEIIAISGVSVVSQKTTKINWKIKFGGQNSQLKEAKYMILALMNKGRRHGYGSFIDRVNAFTPSKVKFNDTPMIDQEPSTLENISISDNLKLNHLNNIFETTPKLKINSKKKRLTDGNSVASATKLKNKTLKPNDINLDTELPIVSVSKKFRKKSLELKDCKSLVTPKQKVSKIKKCKKKSFQCNDNEFVTVLQPKSKMKTLKSNNNSNLETESKSTVSSSKKLKKYFTLNDSTFLTELYPNGSDSKRFEKTALLSNDCNLVKELEPSVSVAKKLKKKTLVLNSTSNLVTDQQPKKLKKKFLVGNGCNLVTEVGPSVSPPKKFKKNTLKLTSNLVADLTQVSASKMLKTNSLLPNDCANIVAELSIPSVSPAKNVKKKTLKLNNNLLANLKPASTCKKLKKKSLLPNDCSLVTELQPTISSSKNFKKKTFLPNADILLTDAQPVVPATKKLKKKTLEMDTRVSNIVAKLKPSNKLKQKTLKSLGFNVSSLLTKPALKVSSSTNSEIKTLDRLIDYDNNLIGLTDKCAIPKPKIFKKNTLVCENSSLKKSPND